MKRCVLSLTLFFFLTSACSQSLDGLWVANDENALLNFQGDIVIRKLTNTRAFDDTMRFQLTKDLITFIGTGNRRRPFRKSFKVNLKGDSLSIWYSSDNKAVYVKSSHKNYLDHFSSRGNIAITVPHAENAKQSFYGRAFLDIKIGFRGDSTIIIVDDIETTIINIDSIIKKFIENTYEWQRYDIICRLFIGRNAKCDYMNWLFPILRENHLRGVVFVTHAADYDLYTERFHGIRYVLPAIKMNQGE